MLMTTRRSMEQTMEHGEVVTLLQDEVGGEEDEQRMEEEEEAEKQERRKSLALLQANQQQPREEEEEEEGKAMAPEPQEDQQEQTKEPQQPRPSAIHEADQEKFQDDLDEDDQLQDMDLPPVPINLKLEAKLQECKPSGWFYYHWLWALLAPIQCGWTLAQIAALQPQPAIAHEANEPDRLHFVQTFQSNGSGSYSSRSWDVMCQAWMVGGVVGSLASSLVSNKLGRADALKVNCLIMVASSICQFGPDKWDFIIGRLVSGIAAGLGSSVASVYLTEIAPNGIRAQCVAAVQVAITMGAFLVYLMAENDQQTHTAAFFGLVVPMGIAVLQLIGSAFVVESPRWLITMGHMEQAQKAIEKLYGDEDLVDFVLDRLVNEENNKTLLVEPSTENATNSRQMDTKTPVVAWTERQRWRCLLARFRSSLLVTMGLALAYQLPCVNAVFYYSYPSKPSALFMVPTISNGTTAIAVIASLFAMLLLQNSRRRTMLLAYAIVSMVCGIVLAFTFTDNSDPDSSNHFWWYAPMILYVASFQLAVGDLVWLVTCELFPTRVRANGVALTCVVNWLALLAMVNCVPHVMTSTKGFLLLVVAELALVVLLWIQLPETKDKSLEEIEWTLASKKKKKPAMMDGGQLLSS